MLGLGDADGDVSIHAPREGSDDSVYRHRLDYLAFQSTLPVRGATKCYPIAPMPPCVSIHAPREGSDFATMAQ